MPYKYHESVNIYDNEAIASSIRTQETQIQVTQGKIAALITDAQLEELRSGSSTMYSRVVNVEATTSGLSSTVTTLSTNLSTNYSTTTAVQSMIDQKADDITLSVSRTYATKSDVNSDIGGLNDRLTSAEQKITPTAIVSTVVDSNGFGNTVVSKINQTASSVVISANHINLQGAVTADCLTSNSVTAVKIASGAVETDKLAANAVTAAKISAGAITTDKLAANSVTSAKITANAVTATQIAANAITSAKISAGAITTDKLAANAVTAAKINVNDLFAQNITATGTISGAQLIGSTTEVKAGKIGAWVIDGTSGFLKDSTGNIIFSPKSDTPFGTSDGAKGYARIGQFVINNNGLPTSTYYGVIMNSLNPSQSRAALWWNNSEMYTQGVCIGDELGGNYISFANGAIVARVGNNAYNIPDACIAVSDHATRISTLETNYTTLNGTVSTLSGTVNTLSSNAVRGVELAKNTEMTVTSGKVYLLMFHHANTGQGMYFVRGGHETYVTIKASSTITLTVTATKLKWTATNTPTCKIFYF